MKPGVVTHRAAVPAARWLRQKDGEFEGSLGYTERLLSPSKPTTTRKKKKVKLSLEFISTQKKALGH